MHPELTFSEWLTLYSLLLWGYGKIVNLSTTYSVETLRYLLSLYSVS